MKTVTPAEPTEVLGDKFVTGLAYKNPETSEVGQIAVTGIFVEIGSVPTTEFAKEVLDIDEFGRIKIDQRTQRTSAEGIWSAGDCTDTMYHQNNIAAGDAVRALEDIYLYLHAK